LVPKSTPTTPKAVAAEADDVVKEYRVLPSPRAKEAKEEVGRLSAKVADLTAKISGVKITPEQKREAGRLRAALDKVLPYADEEHERVILSNLMFGGLYWSSAVVNQSGSVTDLINNFWGTSQDANVDLHDYVEQMWQMGGATFIAIPLMQLKNRYEMSNEQFRTFFDRTKRHLAEKRLKAGELVHDWKSRLLTRADRVQKTLDETEDVLDSVHDVAFMATQPIDELDLITSGSPDAIRAKNKLILDTIAASGSEFGKPSAEYLKSVNAYSGTVEERVQIARAKHGDYLDSLRRSLQGETELNSNGQQKWAYALQRMSPETKQMILEKSNDEIIDAAIGEMVKLHKSMNGTTYVQMKPERIPFFLEDGRYKTTHEVKSDHSPPTLRVRYETMMGFSPDIDDKIRPASGWVASKEWGTIEPENPHANMNFDLAGRVGGCYGEITVKLKSDVSGRTKYAYGDSLMSESLPISFDETDPDAIYTAYTGMGTGSSGDTKDHSEEQLFRFLQAHNSGSLATINAAEDSGLSLRNRDYYEAIIPGAFSLDEVESLRIPVSQMLGMNLDGGPSDDLATVYTDMTKTEKLRDLGFSDEEIAYLMDAIARDGGKASLPGSGELQSLLRYRKIKRNKDVFDSKGVQVFVTTDKGFDLFDPKSYGGRDGDDIEQLIVKNFKTKLLKQVKDGMTEAARPKTRPAVSDL
jgi:hypothetical protein